MLPRNAFTISSCDMPLYGTRDTAYTSRSQGQTNLKRRRDNHRVNSTNQPISQTPPRQRYVQRKSQVNPCSLAAHSCQKGDAHAYKHRNPKKRIFRSPLLQYDWQTAEVSPCLQARTRWATTHRGDAVPCAVNSPILLGDVYEHLLSIPLLHLAEDIVHLPATPHDNGKASIATERCPA